MASSSIPTKAQVPMHCKGAICPSTVRTGRDGYGQGR